MQYAQFWVRYIVQNVEHLKLCRGALKTCIVYYTIETKNAFFQEGIMRLPKRREAVLNALYKMAGVVTKHNDMKTYYKMWELCSAWNSAHYKTNEEIFMADDTDDEGFFFCIEDDVFHLKED